MSDVVTRWEFPAIVYPRYNYFRDRLLRLVPRFQRVIDAGDLSEALFRGKEWIKEIQNNAKCLEEKLTVTILHDASVDANAVSNFTSKYFLGNDDVKPTESAELSRSPKQIEWKQIEWSDLKELGEKLNIHHPHIYVVLINSKEHAPHIIDSILNDLSIVEHYNTVIYDVSTGKSRQLSDCKTSEKHDFDLRLVNDEQPGLSIMKHIQDLLESKVVDVIEDIATFIRSFELSDGTLPERSLIDEVNVTLKEYLEYQHVKQELCAFIDVTTELETLMQMEESETDESNTSESNEKKTDCRFEFTEDEFNRICKQIAKFTKHTSCEHLSLRYGLKPAITNAFLCCIDFNFVEEFIAHIREKSLKLWLNQGKTTDKTGQNDVAKFFKNTCIQNLQDFLNKAESEVKARLEVVNILNKMQFEIRALLRQTKVKLKVLTKKDIATSPALPLDLQQDLLRLKGIDGCGTIYGKLTLHVSDKPTQSLEDDVRSLLEKYRYKHGFRLEKVSRAEGQAGGYASVEAGNKIKGKLTVKGKDEMKRKYPNIKIEDHAFGSIGCYVKVRKQDEQGEQCQVLFVVTCAHCFIDCERRIDICLPRKDKPFGETGEHLMHIHEEMFDVALIKVNSEMIKNCDTRFKSNTTDGLYARKSIVYDGNAVAKYLEGKDVFKWGASTNHTRGVVISDDYRKHCMHRETSFKFCEDCNILINVPGGSRNDEVFSLAGDSGSVVCSDRAEDGHIDLLSILKGSVSEVSTGTVSTEKILFYNSCHLKKSLEIMAEKINCQIELESTQLLPQRQITRPQLNDITNAATGPGFIDGDKDAVVDSENDMNVSNEDSKQHDELSKVSRNSKVSLEKENSNDSDLGMEWSDCSLDTSEQGNAHNATELRRSDTDETKDHNRDSGIGSSPNSQGSAPDFS